MEQNNDPTIWKGPSNEQNNEPVDPAIWKGTSNKYRSVARLPEGMTGVEALKQYAPDEYRHTMARLEQQAADTFRRIYADRVDGCHRELTVEEWQAFKAAGGEQSW